MKQVFGYLQYGLLGMEKKCSLIHRCLFAFVLLLLLPTFLQAQQLPPAPIMNSISTPLSGNRIPYRPYSLSPYIYETINISGANLGSLDTRVKFFCTAPANYCGNGGLSIINLSVLSKAPTALNAQIEPSILGEFEFEVSACSVVNNTFDCSLSDRVRMAIVYGVPFINTMTPTTAQAGTPFTLTFDGGIRESIYSGITEIVISRSGVEVARRTLVNGIGNFGGLPVGVYDVVLTNYNSIITGSTGIVYHGGGPSNIKTLIIGAAPDPVITSVSPTAAQLCSAPNSIRFDVSGQNFTSSMTARLGTQNVPITFNNSGSITINVPCSNITQAGTYTIFLTNPGSNTASRTIQITDRLPAPSSISINPSISVRRMTPLQATITGNNILPGATITIAGNGINQSLGSNLNLQIPLNIVNTPGVYTITVANPDGQSATTSFTVQNFYSLTLDNISPSSIERTPTATSVMISGVGIPLNATVTIRANASNTTTNLTPSNLTATGFTTNIPADITNTPDTYTITVTGENVQPATINFTVVTTPPYISSYGPASTPLCISPANTTFFVRGRDFSPNIVVRLGTQTVTPTITNTGLPGNDSQFLGFTIPCNTITQTGSYTLSLTNPGSNTVTRTVTITSLLPAPSGITISPVTASMQVTDLPITISGSNISGNAVITISGNGLGAITINSGGTTAIPSSFMRRPGSYTITVTNPDGQSSSTIFVVQSVPAIDLTNISPQSSIEQNSSLSVTFTGTNIPANAIARIQGFDVTDPFFPDVITLKGNPTNLTLTNLTTTGFSTNIPASIMNVPGSYVITVTNPSTLQSDTLHFRIREIPRISSAEISCEDFSTLNDIIIIRGSGFENITNIYVDGVVVVSPRYLSEFSDPNSYYPANYNSIRVRIQMPPLIRNVGDKIITLETPNGTAHYTLRNVVPTSILYSGLSLNLVVKCQNNIPNWSVRLTSTHPDSREIIQRFSADRYFTRSSNTLEIPDQGQWPQPPLDAPMALKYPVEMSLGSCHSIDFSLQRRSKEGLGTMSKNPVLLQNQETGRQYFQVPIEFLPGTDESPIELSNFDSGYSATLGNVYRNIPIKRYSEDIKIDIERDFFGIFIPDVSNLSGIWRIDREWDINKESYVTKHGSFTSAEIPSTVKVFTSSAVFPIWYNFTLKLCNIKQTKYTQISPSESRQARVTAFEPSSFTLPLASNTLASIGTRLKGYGMNVHSDSARYNAEPDTTIYMPITVRGTGFEAGMGIMVNDTIVPTLYIDSVTAKLYLPRAAFLNRANALRIGAYGTQVMDSTGNPSSMPFNVKTLAAKLNTISTTLTTATVANKPWTMVLTGQNFYPGARIIYNGTDIEQSAITVESSSRIRVILPPVPITAGIFTVAVANPAPTDSVSATLTFQVEYPRPVLSATNPVSPNTVIDYAQAMTFYVSGVNFTPTAQVLVNGTPVQTTYYNSTYLAGTVPAASRINARTLSVSVSNPAPGGGTSATTSVSLTHPVPALSTVAPATVKLGKGGEITLQGSYFADSAKVLLNNVQLTSGVTVESPTSIRVALIPSQFTTLGTVSLAVRNPAPGGGTSSVLRTLRVVAGDAVSAEFVRVTTGIVAGNALSRSPYIRFRDTWGNLSDYEGTLSYRTPANTSTGTIALRRSSQGIFYLTSPRFYLADDAYTLSPDSTIKTNTGNRTFDVVPATDFSVTVEGVPSSQVAGATLPSFTVSYFDRFGNPTEDRLGEVRIRHDQKGYLHVLPRTQVEEGIYTTSPLQITTIGSYSVFVTGITVANITGNRTVTITPATTVSAEFQYVDSVFAAGSKQTAFRVTYRDSFGNASEGPTTVTASGTTELGTSSATITLTKHATALYYTAEATAFTVPGAYTLTTGKTTQTGQRSFTVTPLAAYYATLTGGGLPAEQIAGAQLSGLSVRLTDRLGNPITNNIGTVALRHSRGFYHALATTSQANGVYTLQGMQLTTIGTYSLSVGGIATENILGNRITTVVQAPVASAQFQYVDSSFNVGGKQTAFRVTYRDAFGNLLDGADSVIASNGVIGQGSSTATIKLTKYGTGLGVYSAEATQFTVPGNYTLSVPGVSRYTGQRTFTVNSIVASYALVTGVPDTRTAGAQTGNFTIRLTDAQNNAVSNSIGAVTLRHERGFTHLLNVTPQTNGVYNVQGMAVTTVGTYSVNIGGIAVANITGNRSILVTTAPAATAAFQYVDSSFNVGGKQTAFRVTYRDAFGNLVNGSESVTASNSGTAQGSSTSTITLTNVSVGVYSATATQFTVPGAYTISVPGVNQYTGQRTFTVNSIAASYALVTGVPETRTAGAQTGSFTIRLTDAQNNPVSNSIGAVTLRHERGFTHLLTVTPQTNGVYNVQGMQVTTVGTYSVNIGGITVANITGNRNIAITPAQAATAAFQSVDTLLRAGDVQTAFRVTYRDAFGNLTDGAESVNASNGASSTATIALTKTSTGVFTATRVQFVRSGSYTMTVAGGLTLTGTRTFEVTPLSVAKAEITGVLASIPQGTKQSAFTVRYTDRYGNANDFAGDLKFAHATKASASNGTISLTRTSLGVFTAAQTAFTTVATYNLSVTGLAATALSGTTSFVVTSAATAQTVVAGNEISSWKGNSTAHDNSAVQTQTSLKERVAVLASVNVYPNPATAEVSLTVHLGTSERVSLKVYDATGREVATLLADAMLSEGAHNFHLKTNDFASGVYIYRLQSASGMSSGRFTVIK